MFRLGRATRVLLPTWRRGVFHLCVVLGYQGAASDSDKFSLFSQLFGHRHAGWNTKHLWHYRAPLDNRIRDIFGLCVFAFATFLVCLLVKRSLYLAIAVSL